MENSQQLVDNQQKGIGIIGLAGLVVGSAIGGGIFGMMADLSGSAPGPALFAWLLVGTSMLALSLSINNIIRKKPDLEGGMFGYAQAGFGKFAGFVSGWGYWITCWLGNVAFAMLLMSAIGYFIPIFEGGQNIPSVIFATIVLWFMAYLVNRGVENASILNAIATFAKLVPLFIFIVVSIIVFDSNVFFENFSGRNLVNEAGVAVTFKDQVLSCIMVMLWVFVGIEGASVVGSRAKKKSDVGKATVLGLIGLLLVYILASMLPFGVLSQAELQAISRQPAMGYVFELIVGKWGGILINVGLIISLLGVWLSWTILPSETMQSMANNGLLPKKWGKLNKNGAPTGALVLTTIITNIFILTVSFTDKAYHFAYTLGTVSIFMTWLFLGLYQIKISFKDRNLSQLVIGLIASAFQIWSILFIALKDMFIILMMYLPGLYFYYRARKEAGEKEAFPGKERFYAITLGVCGVLAILLFFNGTLGIQ
ncbi:basic amino acid/polyamine antiporter [Alkaliphilus crotonatoxidans]